METIKYEFTSKLFVKQYKTITVADVLDENGNNVERSRDVIAYDDLGDPIEEWVETNAQLFNDHYVLNGKEYKAKVRIWDTGSDVYFDYYAPGEFTRHFKTSTNS